MAKVDGDKLKARYEKARAEYQEHQKRERQKRRKLKAEQDTERKLVAGEFVLFLLENGEYDRNRFMTRLDRYLTVLTPYQVRGRLLNKAMTRAARQVTRARCRPEVDWSRSASLVECFTGVIS